jgi:hypothetical protein
LLEALAVVLAAAALIQVVQAHQVKAMQVGQHTAQVHLTLAVAVVVLVVQVKRVLLLLAGTVVLLLLHLYLEHQHITQVAVEAVLLMQVALQRPVLVAALLQQHKKAAVEMAMLTRLLAAQTQAMELQELPTQVAAAVVVQVLVQQI